MNTRIPATLAAAVIAACQAAFASAQQAGAASAEPGVGKPRVIVTTAEEIERVLRADKG